jgi:hypothetical protein
VIFFKFNLAHNVPTDGSVTSSMASPSLLQTSPLTSRLDDSGEPSLCIAVIGATGELARGKIFPALFALYYSGFLPEVQFNRFSWFFVHAFQRFTSYVERYLKYRSESSTYYTNS